MIKDFAKVNNHPGLVRDLKTKAIVNTDQTAYEVYLSERDFRNQIKQTQTVINQDINMLKTDIQEIKTLLHTFISSKV
jgi:hypothetical protein